MTPLLPQSYPQILTTQARVATPPGPDQAPHGHKEGGEEGEETAVDEEPLDRGDERREGIEPRRGPQPAPRGGGRTVQRGQVRQPVPALRHQARPHQRGKLGPGDAQRHYDDVAGEHPQQVEQRHVPVNPPGKLPTCPTT